MAVMGKLDPYRRPTRNAAQAVRRTAWAAVALGLAIAVGCRQDARMADAELRDPVVADVTIAGLTLDRDATPEMVTFALLRAIKDDVDAGRDLEAREAAFDRQFQLAAPSAIHAQHVRAVGPEHADLKECVYKTSRLWAPTLGHYVGSFDLSFEEALERMHMPPVPTSLRMKQFGSEEKHVLFEARDPDGDPNASVVIRVRLVQQEGRWRVWWVGFDRSRRHLPTGRERTAPDSG